jgi:hypothetical protein
MAAGKAKTEEEKKSIQTKSEEAEAEARCHFVKGRLLNPETRIFFY